MGRRWLAAVVMALVTANAVQVVVPAAETSPAPIAGTAPSYGPKSVSRVPNAAAIVRRIWLPELDAGYDPQGLAVDDGAIYVSGYRSDSLGVRRGPCRVIRIDLETGSSTGFEMIERQNAAGFEALDRNVAADLAYDRKFQQLLQQKPPVVLQIRHDNFEQVIGIAG
jgi:hypothetical protein